jgi:hypothetical protein
MGEFKTPDGEVVKLPSRETIDQWRKPQGDFYDEEFSGQYARACEDNLWDEHTKLREITAKLLKGEIDPAAARAASDNIKWDLARRLRHIFGDKLDVTSKDKEIKGFTVVVATEKDKEILEKI